MKRTGKDSINSWIIAACCSLISLLIYGMIRISALLYVACIVQFQVDRRTASWPFMICDFIQAVLGPVTGIFAHKFGIGSVMIAGCFCMAFGISSNFCAEDISSVTVLWGVLFGIGFGLICPLIPVVITRNFAQNRATAIGFVYVGGYLGIFVFPNVIEFLLENYGLSGTFLLLGGIMMHCLPAAMIMHMPNFSQNSSKGVILKNDQIIKKQCFNSEKTEHAFTKYPISNLPDDSKAENICSELKKYENFNQTLLLQNKLDGRNNDGFVFESNMECNVGDSEYDYKTEKRTDSHKSMDEIPEIKNKIDDEKKEQLFSVILKCELLFPHETETRDLGKYTANTEIPLIYFNSMDAFPLKYGHFTSSKMASSWSLNGGTLIGSKNEIPIVFRRDSQIYSIPIPEHTVPKKELKLRDAFKVFLDPFFFVILYAAAIFVSGYLVFLMIIVDFALDIGLQLSDGKYVIMGYSLACCFGLLSFGWVTDGGYLTPLKLAAIMFFIRSLTLIFIPLSTCLLVLLVIVVIQGFCETSILNLIPLIIAEQYSEDIQEIAITCRLLLCGPVYLATPSLIGYFRDNLGSYVPLFYLLALLSFTSCFLLLMAPFLKKCRCFTDDRLFRKKETPQTDT